MEKKLTNNKQDKIIVVCGPTAVGKTSVGVEICKKFSGEIISADSQQVYRGMDIGTAKDHLTGTGIKCHLIDVVNPDESFDVATFVDLASKAVQDVLDSGKLPVVVGGTGFYIKGLLEGVSSAPGGDEVIREELYKIREEGGNEALYEILLKEDPERAKELNVNDYQRVVRSIEVKRTTGESIRAFKESSEPDLRYDAFKIGLRIEREVLYDRINNRVDKMIELGLREEVKSIVKKYGSDIQSLKAVGYKEIVSFLNGEVDQDEAIRLTKRNSRHFAKRQMTWFRSDKKIGWFDPADLDSIFANITTFIQ